MRTLLFSAIIVGLFSPCIGAERDPFEFAMREQFAGAMGRSRMFLHLEERSKKLDNLNHWVDVTGTYYGLDLKFGERAHVSFPKGKSWVETPAGIRIPLLFKPLHAKRLPGHWTACFSRPHLMAKGDYKYQVTVLVGGVEVTFEHAIYFESEQCEPNQMSSKQIGG